MEQVLIVLSNVPDEASAEVLARKLIEQQVAACVNILPAVRSVYRWQGQVEQATEVTLLMKTTQVRYPALEAAIRAVHPYDVPEIIAVPVVAGLPDYLNWVEQETTKGIDV